MEAFIGEIRLLPYSFSPVGWAPCDGTRLAIVQYQAVFALLGTAFGGDGQNTFALPELRDKSPLPQDGQGGTTSPMRVCFPRAPDTPCDSDQATKVRPDSADIAGPIQAL